MQKKFMVSWCTSEINYVINDCAFVGETLLKDMPPEVRARSLKGEALALDSTLIKAYSRRNLDNRTGYSDPESRIARAMFVPK